MKIKIEFDTENDAFVEDFAGELRRVFRQAKKQIENFDEEDKTSEDVHVLRDINGNTVGRLFLTGG